MTRAMHHPAGVAPGALARAAVLDVSVYAGTESPCAVDVSDNTNLWGSPPSALAAIRDAAREGAGEVARYPRAYSSELVSRLLAHHGFKRMDGVDVVVGCGSDDVLDAAMRAFSVDGARIAYSVPTFSMISTFARLSGLTAVEIPLRDDFDVDVGRLIDAGANLTYLCAPNNPTGTAVTRAAVERVLSGTTGIVIVDEAYAEFGSSSLMDLVTQSPRLLVTRTFSKAFGLAGVRVGYGVGSEALTDLVARARGPYKVSVPGERAAIATLGAGPGGLGWVHEHVGEAVAMRAHLQAALAALGLRVLPSDANFVFAPLREAEAVARCMLGAGVRVRAMSGLDGPGALREEGGAGLRIGVAPFPVMEVVIAALRAALETVAPHRLSGSGPRTGAEVS